MVNAIFAPAVQAAEGVGGVVLAAHVAVIILAAAVLVLAVLGAVLFWRANLILRDVRRSAERSLAPVSDRAARISDNVEFITQSLRTDVESLNASVRSLSERLSLASDRMEERIEEFNALMTVVQGEAESVFLDTASTVRGVREGARAIADRGGSGERSARAQGDHEDTHAGAGSSAEGADEENAGRLSGD